MARWNARLWMPNAPIESARSFRENHNRTFMLKDTLSFNECLCTAARIFSIYTNITASRSIQPRMEVWIILFSPAISFPMVSCWSMECQPWLMITNNDIRQPRIGNNFAGYVKPPSRIDPCDCIPTFLNKYPVRYATGSRSNNRLTANKTSQRRISILVVSHVINERIILILFPYFSCQVGEIDLSDEGNF